MVAETQSFGWLYFPPRHLRAPSEDSVPLPSEALDPVSLWRDASARHPLRVLVVHHSSPGLWVGHILVGMGTLSSLTEHIYPVLISCLQAHPSLHLCHCSVILDFLSPGNLKL